MKRSEAVEIIYAAVGKVYDSNLESDLKKVAGAIIDNDLGLVNDISSVYRNPEVE